MQKRVQYFYEGCNYIGMINHLFWQPIANGMRTDNTFFLQYTKWDFVFLH